MIPSVFEKQIESMFDQKTADKIKREISNNCENKFDVLNKNINWRQGKVSFDLLAEKGIIDYPEMFKLQSKVNSDIDEYLTQQDFKLTQFNSNVSVKKEYVTVDMSIVSESDKYVVYQNNSDKFYLVDKYGDCLKIIQTGNNVLYTVKEKHNRKKPQEYETEKLTDLNKFKLEDKLFGTYNGKDIKFILQ